MKELGFCIAVGNSIIIFLKRFVMVGFDLYRLPEEERLE